MLWKFFRLPQQVVVLMEHKTGQLFKLFGERKPLNDRNPLKNACWEEIVRTPDLKAVTDRLYSGGQPEIKRKMRLAGAAGGPCDLRECCSHKKFFEAHSLLFEGIGAFAVWPLDLEYERELHGHSRMERGIQRRPAATQAGKADSIFPFAKRQLAAIDAKNV